MGIDFDVSLGSAYNFISDITIHSQVQGGQDLHLSSQPSTYGLKSPQYYSLRVRHRNKEFELIHHKLYFEKNLPTELNHFEITDGYNMLMLNILEPLNFQKYAELLSIRFGLGVVVAHPDVTINGKRFYQMGGGLIPTVWTDGYQISGLSSQIGFNIIKKLKNKFSLNAETKISYAKATIDLEEEYSIKVPNLSIHVLMGICFGK